MDFNIKGYIYVPKEECKEKHYHPKQPIYEKINEQWYVYLQLPRNYKDLKKYKNNAVYYNNQINLGCYNNTIDTTTVNKSYETFEKGNITKEFIYMNM
jgi:hypothetical protein